VVAIVPSRRRGGIAAINEHGLIPKSFRIVNQHKTTAADQAATITNLVKRSVKKYQPSVLVIGRIPRQPGHDGVLAAALAAGRQMGVAVVERSIDEVRPILMASARRVSGNTLAATLAEGFFPELRDVLARGIDHFIFRRHAWNACGLALIELTRLFPAVAARLRQPGTGPLPRFDALLRGADGGPPENLPVEPRL
jgi:hypothetical protein